MEAAKAENLGLGSESDSKGRALGARGNLGLRCVFLLLCLIAIRPAIAESNGPKAEAPVAISAEPEEPKTKLENWYLMWNAGFSSMQYSGIVKEEVDLAAATHRRFSMTFDLIGVYVRFRQPRTIFGGVLTSSIDNLSARTSSEVSLSVTQLQISASVMHFFGRTVGEGFFVRADLGLCAVGFTPNYSYRLDSLQKNGGGLGFLAGGGYAVPVSEDSRILFGANYTVRVIPNHTLGVFTASVGWLY